MLNNKVTFVAKLAWIELSTNEITFVWINHTFQLIFFAFWIMGGPITNLYFYWSNACRSWRDTVSGSTASLNQFGTTSAQCLETRLTNLQMEWPAASAFLVFDPVIEDSLDQEFFANGPPERNVHGFVICLTQWNCIRYTRVRCESVLPN